MKKIIFVLFIIVFILCSFSAAKERKKASVSAAEKKSRPSVALVLSGGGARGIAHVGVLKKLEEYGIKPDYILGTSMGSFIGALYASGYSADQIENIILNADMTVFSDDIPDRRYVPLDRRDDNRRFLVSVPFGGDGLSAVTGVIRGVRLHAFLNRLFFHVNSVRDYSRLPIPFICIGTDIYTGEEVILDHGHLPTSVRASISVPSVFSPVDADGYTLVDGGLVDNFPVALAREKGADIVIGVDVGTPLILKEDKSELSIANIIDQMGSFKGAERTKEQREICDILIVPELKNLTSFDFLKGEELISVGEKAAVLQSEKLIQIGSYFRKTEKREDIVFPEINASDDVLEYHISEMRIEGGNRVSEDLVKNRVEIEFPASLKISDIEDCVFRVYASGFYKNVTYRIDRTDAGDVLVLKVEEKKENSINLGIRYDTDTNVSMLLNARFVNLLGSGSSADIEGILGENPAFHVDYSHLYGWPIRFGFGFKVWADQISLYSYKDNWMSGHYRYKDHGFGVFGNVIMFHNLLLGVGVKKSVVRVRTVISLNERSNENVESLNPCAYFLIDSMNRNFFPDSGIKLRGVAELITDKLPLFHYSSLNGKRMYLDGDLAVPLHKRISLLVNGFMGILGGNKNHLANCFSIGGQNEKTGLIYPFIGKTYASVTGNEVYAGGAGIQVRILSSIFIQLRGNTALVKDNFQSQLTSKHYSGYGVTAGLLSPAGPVEWTLAFNEGKQFSSYLSLGFSF